MLLVASESLTSAEGRDPIPTATLASLRDAVDEIVFEGVEAVGNHSAYRLAIDNPGLTEMTDDGHHFTVNKIERWIHLDLLLEVKTRISGVVSELRSQSRNRRSGPPARGEGQEIVIEQEFGDFRRLPGTQMWHPFRETTRVGGVLSKKDRKQMSEAAKSLDEIEQQMAGMSPEDRLAMEQMMGDRIDQLRSMIDTGMFEFTLITTRVLVNTDARAALSGNVPYDRTSLVQEIQYNLQALGYAVDNTEGELTKGTAVAIIRYQDDYRLELTGRPTPELARIMSATMSATR
jgi:hypothetical protein